MNAAGIIFSDSYDVVSSDLTKYRTLAAVPFGGRYRVVDFTVSGMVNAGIDNIGIIATRNYIDLMQHMRGGTAWNLDTKRTSLTFLPPFGSDNVQGMYNSRLEALQTHVHFISKIKEEYVILSGCNYIGNVDIRALLDAHMESGAKLTALYTRKPMFKAEGSRVNKYIIGKDGHIDHVEPTHELSEGDALGINCFVMARTDLVKMIEETKRTGGNSFHGDVFAPIAKAGEAMGYETDATLMFMDDTAGYLRSSLALLNRDIRQEIFEQPQFPIITRAQDSAPGKYGKDAVVENCLIADGVRIEGTVRNSIIFRDVIIKKGSVVENSVLMQDAIVGENVNLSYTILDNNVVINDGRSLGGYITHPFYLDKGTVI